MYRFILAFMLLNFFFLFSCSSDSEEDLMPDNFECITVNMSYETDILPILNRNCLGCHSAAVQQGGVDLEGYEALKLWVDNGVFLGSIKWETGFSRMPKNLPQLPTCDISKIESWIDSGAPNN